MKESQHRNCQRSLLLILDHSFAEVWGMSAATLLEPGGGVFVTEHLHVVGGELLLSNTTAFRGGQAVWRIRVSSALEALQGAFGGH